MKNHTTSTSPRRIASATSGASDSGKEVWYATTSATSAPGPQRGGQIGSGAVAAREQDLLSCHSPRQLFGQGLPAELAGDELHGQALFRGRFGGRRTNGSQQRPSGSRFPAVVALHQAECPAALGEKSHGILAGKQHPIKVPERLDGAIEWPRILGPGEGHRGQ